MELQFLQNNQIDKKKWDETIATCSYGNAFVQSWYLDAIFPTWSAIVCDDYEFVFPLMINAKYGLKYFYTPIYGMQYGIFGKKALNVTIEKAFWDYIPFTINSTNISLHPFSTYKPKKHRFYFRTCQYLNLDKSYKEIYDNYSSNLKRNLSKANKLNLKILESKKIEDVVSMFQNGRGSKLTDLKEIHYTNLYNLISNGLEAKKVRILECYEDREIIASGFFSFCNNRIIYHKGGANHKGRKYGAMHLMIDYLIQEYQNTEYTFDFGGSSIENVKRFNNNFTDKEYTYPVLKKPNFLIDLIRKYKTKPTKGR
jgi:hypothetical protein